MDRHPRFPKATRVGVGLLLFVAAGLKLHGLGEVSFSGSEWTTWPWVQLAVAEWEFVLAIWLISGTHSRMCWLAAMATFLAFSAVTLQQGLAGKPSCGCLGAVTAKPWLLFTVDCAAIVLLAAIHPRRQSQSLHESRGSLKRIGAMVVLLFSATLLARLEFGSVAALMARLRGESLFVDSLDLGAGDPGELIEVSATVHNLSDRAVDLIGGSSDCSCTLLNDLPKFVGPRGSENVLLQFVVPETSKGRITKVVSIRTSDAAQSVVFFKVMCQVN